MNKIELFMEWYRTVCSPDYALTFDADPNTGRRGLFLTRDVSPRDTVLWVTENCMMSSKTAVESDLFVLKTRHEDLTWKELLPLFLIYEYNNPESFWRPYLDLLPKHVHTPLFWSDEELEELRGTRLYEITLSRRVRLDRQYEKDVVPLLDEFRAILKPEYFTKDSYAWAISVIESRSAPIHPNLRNPPEGVLAPFFDGANHKIGADWNIRYDRASSTPRTALQTTRAMKKGEEYFIDYGPVGAPEHNNEMLLNKMGFVIADHPSDFYTFSLEHNPTCCLAHDATDTCEERKKLLMGRRQSGQTYLLRSSRPRLDNNFITYLFTCHTEMYPEYPCKFDDIHQPEDKTPQCRGSRINMWKAVLKGIESQLAAYPTSLEEDEAKTSGAAGAELEMNNYTVWAATVMRRNEKRILYSWQTRLISDIARLEASIEADGWAPPPPAADWPVLSPEEMAGDDHSDERDEL